MSFGSATQYKDFIEKGMSPDQARDAVRQLVFGEGYTTEKGKPVENGIGSPGHENHSHWEALRKAEREGREPPGTTDRLMAEAAARRKR